eukprot:11025924-Alexandrium_andersonii.AAC.1
MSASLVGSEMCIRDSQRSALGSRLRFDVGERAQCLAGVGGQQEQGAQPVSYTHLTLPTICSV